MKIGFDAKRAYLNYTGLGNYSRDLIKSLLDKNLDHQYFLYTPKYANNPRFNFIKERENVISRSPETPLNKTFKGFWRSMNLEKTLIKDNVDIFHGLSNEIPRRRKFGKERIKYVVTIHDLIFKRYPRNYKTIDRRIYNVKFKYAAKNADKIIAISEQTKQDIIDFYKIPSNKIEVIYQSCHQNFRKEYSEEIQEHIRNKFQLPEKYILNVGTVETRKNLNAILQAIPFMKNNLPIVVVGRKTKYMNFLKVQMQKLKVNPERFLFLDGVSIDELPSIYSMAEVFVYPSVFEGFGIPIIEALYRGTPVITTKGSCFPEAGGPDTIYCDTFNFEEVAKTIDSLLNDESKRKSMSEKGIGYAQKFNQEIAADKLMQLYYSI